MPSNNGGIQIGYMAGKYPNRIGWLLSPDGWQKPPTWMPYAIDNGAYGAWSNNIPWNEDKFLNHLEKTKTAPKKPLWVVVFHIYSFVFGGLSFCHTSAPCSVWTRQVSLLLFRASFSTESIICFSLGRWYVFVSCTNPFSLAYSLVVIVLVFDYVIYYLRVQVAVSVVDIDSFNSLVSTSVMVIHYWATATKFNGFL